MFETSLPPLGLNRIGPSAAIIFDASGGSRQNKCRVLLDSGGQLHRFLSVAFNDGPAGDGSLYLTLDRVSRGRWGRGGRVGPNPRPVLTHRIHTEVRGNAPEAGFRACTLDERRHAWSSSHDWPVAYCIVWSRRLCAFHLCASLHSLRSCSMRRSICPLSPDRSISLLAVRNRPPSTTLCTGFSPDSSPVYPQDVDVNV